MIETIVEALERHALKRPSSAAVCDGRYHLGWADAKAWSDRAAGWLLERRLQRGAPVLGWLPNGVEWYLLRLACEKAGLFWVPVPASQGRRELASILARVRPAVVVTPGQFRGRNYAADAQGILDEQGLKPALVHLPAGRLLELEGPPCDPGEALRLDEPAHALATTGSEGTPKLAVFTLAAACERAHAQAKLLRLSAADVLLTLSPGVGPARAAWLAAPVAGACVVGMPVFGTEAALEAIARERPTLVCGTPAQLAMVAAKLDRIDCSSVRFWYTAGSVMPATLARELEARTGAIVLSTYGGADFGGWAAPDPDDPPSVRHNTVGKPRGGTEFRVIDRGGNDVPQGTSGELIGRGPCCASGYLGEEGSDRWREGWFHTGDLALLDGAGNIVIVGRLKDVINRGGDNVVPAEVEALLLTHADVSQAAVVAVPDAVLGERVCACVVAAAGRAPDLARLRERLQQQGMAHYKLPEQLLVLDALPIIGDKVDRRKLAALAAGRNWRRP